MSEDTTKVTCPHCSHEIGFQYTAKAADTSRLRYAIKPMPGEYMTAQVVGATLKGIADLLVASGKSLGANSVVLVEKIENGLDPGAIDFHLLVARGPAFDARKKRMKAAKK
jgi:hypothetical protein